MPLLPLPDPSFRDRFPTWVRIEPRSRDDDFSGGLEARTADPLWMLGRQWQMGEFDGEDTGSAITVSVSYRSSAVTKASWPNDATMPQSERAVGPPIDLTIEGHGFEWDWRRRVHIGQRYEALIREQPVVVGAAPPQAIIARLRRLMPLQPTPKEDAQLDSATRRYLGLMAGRVIDGKRVSDEIDWTAANSLAPRWALAPNETAAIAALRLLAEWLREVYPALAEGAAWHEERLRHEFTLTATGNGTSQLVARDHQGGAIDWFDVTIVKGDPPPATAQPPVKTVRGVPTRVAFAGAPHPRWWAFEDSRAQLGTMEVNTTDVAKLAMLDFALMYANDWLSLPLAVEAGCLVDIATVLVTDVFGRSYKLAPSESLIGSGLKRWQLYAVATEGAQLAPGVSQLLFVPPISGDALELPVEELLFLRDEGANLVFGVEQRVPNGRGDSVPGIELQRERGYAGEVPDDRGVGRLRFKLATPVPGNWFPFVPVARDKELREVRLRKAQLLREHDDDAPSAIPPLGALLKHGGDWLEEASVLRSGVKVQLVRRRARGVDGKTYVWMGHQVGAGKGEGRSGLRFDLLKEESAP